ncbi:Matrix Gla protein [Anas platyrhynchos]|uniref:Matrix Gla protein n=1 Tax=Anas platyrhynchos TaxID=8839 RepID=R0L8E3_ANAPL|nr:Matrix Gla protein [Anas platyrhynchos]
MRTLIILTLLATLIMAATCYDPFINRRRANGFMQTDMRLEAIAQERIRERNKAPQERQREICEDYYPCELYASRHGYAAAYRHYYGRRRTK